MQTSLMNDLLYYEPLADLLEADKMYRNASTQVGFGYLTFEASFHRNLLTLLGDILTGLSARCNGSRFLRNRFNGFADNSRKTVETVSSVFTALAPG